MATRVKNDKGFLVIKCSVFDLMETEPASMGICDKCGNHDLSGYIICALGHRWYCNDCYHKWVKQAVYYPEDQDFETKIFNEYRKNFILAKRWEKNDEKNNTKQGGKMIFKNKKKKLSFEERMELALTKTKFTKKQKDIVRTWYEIEDSEPDISTERLIAMTADISDVEYEYVVDTICEFSTYMD